MPTLEVLLNNTGSSVLPRTGLTAFEEGRETTRTLLELIFSGHLGATTLSSPNDMLLVAQDLHDEFVARLTGSRYADNMIYNAARIVPEVLASIARQGHREEFTFLSTFPFGKVLSKSAWPHIDAGRNYALALIAFYLREHKIRGPLLIAKLIKRTPDLKQLIAMLVEAEHSINHQKSLIRSIEILVQT